jgi:hypothetical protein
MMAITARPHGGLPCFPVETLLSFSLNGAPPATTAEGATRFGCRGFALGMGAGVGVIVVAVSRHGRLNICPRTTARLGFVAAAKMIKGQLRGWRRREASGEWPSRWTWRQKFTTGGRGEKGDARGRGFSQ